MGKHSKKNIEKYDGNELTMPALDELNSKNKKRTNFFEIIQGPLIVAGVIAAVGWGINTHAQLRVIENNISHFTEDIEDMQVDISTLQTDIDKIKTDVSSLQTAVADLQETVYGTHTINLTSSAIQNMQVVRSQNDISIVSSPAWGDTDVVGTDVNTGKIYTAEELKNTKILMPYTQDGQEVYFLGQFSDNIRWDGTCIINIYKDNQLILISEAIYDDGMLLSYKQVLPDTNNAGKKVWLISERVCVDKVNSGETWSYICESDYVKSFDMDNVLVSDIFDVENFQKTIDLKLEGYYYGNTSGGALNDDTGEAYIVKYFDDGTVRTLYKGCVKNGNFNDDTNNAWYITKEEDTSYMYYKGKFKDGIPQNNVGSEFINPISVDEIKEIIQNQEFKSELRWQEK